MTGLILGFLLAQGWWRTYDNGGFDWGYSVCVDGSNNVIVAGSSTNNPNGLDAHVWKYDPNGTLLWDVTRADPGDEWVRNVCVDALGNIYIVMTDYSVAVGDARVTKYTPAGVFVGEDTYDGGRGDEGYGITYAAGGVYMAGYTMNADSNYDILAIKYDTVGTPTRLWVTIWDETGIWPWSEDIGHTIDVGPNGNPVVGGSTHYLLVSTDPDALLVEFRASDGAYVRDTIPLFSPTADDIIEDIDIRSTGQIAVVGRIAASPERAVVGVYTFTNRSWWDVIQDASYRRSLYGVDISNNNDTVLVAGLWETTSTNRDFWLRKYTWAGSNVWDTLIDHTPGSHDWAEDCLWDNTGLYTVSAGGTQVSGNSNMLVYKLPIQSVDLEEGGKPSLAFSASPCPFFSEITITGSEGPFQVFDPAGRVVMATTEKTFGRGLAPGVYFIGAPEGMLRVVKIQ